MKRIRNAAKTLTLRLDDETYQAFARAARAQWRSLANLIETAALLHLRESSFADDAEMAEIASRPELVKRLRAGAEDAKKRSGRFVSKTSVRRRSAYP
ncbi:MAG TPA: CopG family transcriptional regulator [Terriglobia bacterium]|nr:CopG family transcriptional regulator [Terriglobia bacterium]